MRKLTNPFKELSRFEWCLWIVSVVVIAASFLISKGGLAPLLASIIGVTAVLFVAKGFVLGQLIMVVFAVFYGVISYSQRYYGEMLTYLLMTLPIAVASVVTWIKNPYKDTSEVKVHRMTRKEILVMSALAVITTVAFYFILKTFSTANLIPSTISVTTSFVAAYMTMLRSPYYALGYAANDIVIIVLWILASIQDIFYLPMVFCFVMFLVNDSYGFFNWQRMQKRQEKNL